MRRFELNENTLAPTTKSAAFACIAFYKKNQLEACINHELGYNALKAECD